MSSPIPPSVSCPPRPPRARRLPGSPLPHLRRHWVRWALALALGLLLALTVASAGPVISEFMAANTSVIADEDGAFSDWIELYNPEPTPLALGGWFLTDTATNRRKWQFPELTLPAGGYLLVWASNKNRRDPARPLHTNFALSSGGEYLGLIAPDGVTVVSEYAPTFPAQRDNVAYGISQAAANAGEIGFLVPPTPRARNGAAARNALTETVTFSRAAGPCREPFALQLSGAGPGQRIRYVMTAPSPAGFALPPPTAASPEYREPLPISESRAIRAAVFSADGTLSGPVAQAHYVMLDASLATFASDLPVLVLDNHGYGGLVKDGVDHPGWLYLYPARGMSAPVFAVAPALASALTFTVRGQSASEFPKKSYNLKFTDEAGRRREQTLFGSLPYEKWALVSPWCYDRTFLYNCLAYALSNRLGRWAPRTQLVEVFLNPGPTLGPAAYHGIAALTDRIEVAPGRVEITPLSAADVEPPAITGGYLVKIDAKDDDEFGFVTARGEPANSDAMVVVAYPKDADLAPAQRTYIQEHIQAMEDALHADAASQWQSRTYLDYIDRPTWVDYHLLSTLTANPDAFLRSTYFTNERSAPLRAGPPWDFDRAFNSCDGRNVGPEGWRGDSGDPDLWHIGWWRVLVRDPEFLQEWIDRWQALRLGPLAAASLTGLVDTLAQGIGRAAAARDAARWPDNASRFGDHAGEVNDLKEWLVRRAAWIDAQFVPAPTLAVEGTTVRLSPPAGALLVYTLDGSDPRSVGGAIAPNARITSEILVVTRTADVHARSLSSDPAPVFPRTRWSGAVDLPGASPLRPESRLINVSARATLGPEADQLATTVVIADTGAKGVLLRGVGPALAPFLAEPTLDRCQVVLHSGTDPIHEICRNSGWDAGAEGASLAALFPRLGAFPLAHRSGDAAATATLPAGTFTLTLASANDGAGVGLTEIYALDSRGRIAAFASRTRNGEATGPLVAGFVLAGGARQRVLVRASAPPTGELERASAPLPTLALYQGTHLLGTNADWTTAPNAAEIAAAGGALGLDLGPAGSGAAVFVTLPPGIYTAVLEEAPGLARETLLEVFVVP